MPRYTYATRADYDRWSWRSLEPDGHPGNRPAVVLGYSKWSLILGATENAEWMHGVMQNPAAHVLLVGAGMGWTAEVLRDAYGYATVVGTEPSGFVQGNKSSIAEEVAHIEAKISEVGLDPLTGRGAELRARALMGRADNGPATTATVVNEALTNNGSRNRVWQALGGHIDWIWTEQVLESLDDAEILSLAGNVEAFDPTIQIGHIVRVTPSARFPDMNIKTLEEWKALLPAHTIMAAEHGAVL